MSAAAPSLYERLKEMDQNAGPRVGFDSQLDAATCRAALPTVLSLVEQFQALTDDVKAALEDGMLPHSPYIDSRIQACEEVLSVLLVKGEQ